MHSEDVQRSVCVSRANVQRWQKGALATRRKVDREPSSVGLLEVEDDITPLSYIDDPAVTVVVLSWKANQIVPLDPPTVSSILPYLLIFIGHANHSLTCCFSNSLNGTEDDVPKHAKSSGDRKSVV